LYVLEKVGEEHIGRVLRYPLERLPKLQRRQWWKAELELVLRDGVRVED
jgi:hypothetical protein